MSRDVDDTNLSLLVETDLEKSNGPSSTPARSAWRFKFCKYGPFALHFALAVIVALACLRFLDGSTFNVNSRQPQYLEADGSISHLTSYALLQSDVTTAVSLAATVTRVVGGWWATGYIWRCIFVAMERGGISSKGLSQVISNRPPAPRHFARKSNMVIIYITLFATFAIDYFSAVLTGSFVWEAADMLIPGKIPLTGIARGVGGENVTGYIVNSSNQDWITAIGCASANVAWGTLQSDPILNMTKPSTIFRRVIKGAQYISTNSTLADVRIPYFSLDSFDWVPDPDHVLTDEQFQLLGQYNQFSPYFSYMGIVGLLRDSYYWGSTFPTELVEGPHIVSETRPLSFRIERILGSGSCPQNYTVDPGLQINLLQFVDAAGYTDCFAIANVTYQAGAIACQNCKLISPTVVEARAPLPLIGDPFTSMALALAPSLGTNLLFSNYAIPLNYGTRKNLAIELTSRAYQAAWATFSDAYGSESNGTTVEIALPTLRAKVIRWRVYLWVALHLWVLVLGLLFIYVQSHCDHPWVEDMTMAIFWLDTRAVLTKSDSQGVSLDPWQPGVEIRDDGMLILELDEAGQRSVQLNNIRDSRS